MCPRLEIFLFVQEVYKFYLSRGFLCYIYRGIKIRNFYKFHTILLRIIRNCRSKENYTLETSEKFTAQIGPRPPRLHIYK